MLIQSDVVLSAELTNAVDTLFQWVRGGADIPGATNATYVISSIDLEDVGDYSLRVQQGNTIKESQPAAVGISSTIVGEESFNINFIRKGVGSKRGSAAVADRRLVASAKVRVCRHDPMIAWVA